MSRGISIFSRYYSFLGNHYPKLSDGVTILRLTHETRGKQVAEYIGAKFNPKNGYENDLCIHIKPTNLDKVGDGDYVDFSDSRRDLIDKLRSRPKIKVIAHSLCEHKYLKERLPNELVHISQQHLNWERDVRDRKGVTVGGYIGRPSRVAVKINREIEDRLKGIGIKWVNWFNWSSRQDAIDFYKNVDFLVIGGHGILDEMNFTAVPTKMINAASFGVPSIAYWRAGYEEFEGYYAHFQEKDDLLSEVERLKDESYYQDKSMKLMEKAEEYHLSNVAKLYLELK